MTETGESSGIGDDEVAIRRARAVAFVLGAAAVVASPSTAILAPAERAELLVGGVLLALGVGALLRRGIAAAPPEDHPGPFATALARVAAFFDSRRGGGSKRRPEVLGLAASGASLGSHLLTGTAVGFGALGVGIFATGFVALALALAMGCFVLATRQLRSDDLGPTTPYTIAISMVFLLLQTLLVLPYCRDAWNRLRPVSRVRFELGGLGTRVEDMTERTRRDVGFGEAATWLVFGGALVFAALGWSGLGVAAVAIVVAPGIASTAAQIGGPLVALGFAVVAAAKPGLIPFVAVAVPLALLIDSQRFTVLVRGTPIASDRGFACGGAIAACVVAACSAMSTAHSVSQSVAMPEFLNAVGTVAIAVVAILLVVSIVRSALGVDVPTPDDFIVGPIPRDWRGRSSMHEYLPLGVVGMGIIVPPWTVLCFALGALIGRIVRGSKKDATTPDPLAAIGAGSVAGEVVFGLALIVSVAFG